MPRLKGYTGTNVTRTYINGGVARNEGGFYPIVNPSSISSLQYWFDPVENTITTNGSDQVLSISNSGNAGGNFSFYPGTSTFDPATKANFVKGTGDTQYYRFVGAGNDSMYTVYKSLKNDDIEAQTVISIARRDTVQNYALWGVSWTSDPEVNQGELDGIRHPQTDTSLTLDMRTATSGGTNNITPPSSIGSYTLGGDNFEMFAATCTDGNWINETDSIRFQSNLNNNTATTQSNPYTYTSYYPIFTIHVGSDLNPGAFERGNDEYAAVMVFDEILDEETIGGIYRYYKETRGYSIT